MLVIIRGVRRIAFAGMDDADVWWSRGPAAYYTGHDGLCAHIFRGSAAMCEAGYTYMWEF